MKLKIAILLGLFTVASACQFAMAGAEGDNCTTMYERQEDGTYIPIAYICAPAPGGNDGFSGGGGGGATDSGSVGISGTGVAQPARRFSGN